MPEPKPDPIFTVFGQGGRGMPLTELRCVLCQHGDGLVLTDETTGRFLCDQCLMPYLRGPVENIDWFTLLG